MSIAMFGIPNCDTVKKARVWLDANRLAFAFHDYKKEGVDPARLARWAETEGWERLLNRAGTTFRKLDAADKADIDAAKALALMVAHPSTIKRPVVEYRGGVLVGFKPDEWAAALL